MTHDGFRTALHGRLAAISVLVVVGLLASACTSSTSSASSASPVEATNTASTAPSLELPMNEVRSRRLDPGTYADLDVDRQGFNVRFTVPAGWTWNGRYLSKGGIGLPGGAAIFFFGGPVQVYADPCHWAGTHSDPLTGRNVDRLTAALAAQPMRSATTPIHRPADTGFTGPGLAGMSVDLTVPDNVNFSNCDGGQFRSWGPQNNVRIHQGPGQRDLVWAVDVMGAGIEGTGVFPPGGLIIDAASFSGTPTDVISEIEAILGSIYVGHWG